MAEAAALVGLIAAIAQFVEYGMKLVERLEDFSISASDRTSAFTAIRVRLPAVIGIIKRIKRQIDDDLFDPNQAATLFPVIENTNAHIHSLMAIIERSMPPKKSSLISKYIKAMRSLSLDAEVQRISARIQDNLQIISLFQTTNLVDAAHQTALRLSSQSQGISGESRKTAPSETQGTVSIAEAEEARTGLIRRTPLSITDRDDIDIQLTISSSPQIGQLMPNLTDDEGPVQPQAASEKLVVGSPNGERCSSSCSCICHRPYQLSTPSFLTHLVGHLSVNYAGQAFVKVQCNEKKCRRRNESAARMTYRFPNWALDRVVHMALSSTALNTKVNLNTLRVLPDSAEVFAVMSRGDVDKFRNMFKAGQASIYDVSRLNWTLIHTAFTLGRMDMVHFLLTEGADLTIDAANGSNVIERAWFLAQKTSKTPGDYVMCDNEVLKKVDLDDFVSSQQYSLIHKIVLGITKLNLEEVLESSTSSIDETDIRGATPLWWAAAQGNLHAVRTLLNNGANHAIGAGLSQQPLHVARNADVVRILLQYNVAVDPRDTVGRTPLHCFCYRQVDSSPSIVREILNGGAAIDAVASGGQTPLHYAATFGNTSLIPVLLEYGANIDALKDERMTSLMVAIRYDKPETVRCLLENQANWKMENIHRQNALHIAAVHAGSECMDILASLDLRQLKPNARDARGFTPKEYFEDRKFRFEDLDDAFQRLLAATGNGSFGDDRNDDEHDDHERELNDSDRSESFAMPGSFTGT